MPSRTKKLRGSRTHGRGKKAGRGAGLRGGRGNAGLNKHKKLFTLKYLPNHFGRKGFKRPPQIVKPKKTINVGEIKYLIPSLLKKGLCQKKGDIYIINFLSSNIDKLLGNGKIDIKTNIFINSYSSIAKRKIEYSKGTITNSK